MGYRKYWWIWLDVTIEKFSKKLLLLNIVNQHKNFKVFKNYKQTLKI